MPGANYMGGKRNAARARIKDTEGKAQRSHFGKKRFEVLRTGLSKGAARDVRRELPEITLAHARRRRGQDGLKDEREWERNRTGLRSPSTSPVLLLRSSPVNTTSGRSKILTMLDADDPAVRRAQVQKILLTPDLLGLSKAKEQMSSHKTAKSESRVLCTPVRTQKSSSQRHVFLKSPTLEGSPSSAMDPGHFQRTPSSRSTSRERAISSSSGQCSRLSSHGAESAFVPMFLDSSPPPYADDSGYAEFCSDPYYGYEAMRAPFNTDQRHLLVSSMSGVAASPLSHAPSHGSLYPPASPSHLELPSLVEARFVSEILSPKSTQDALEPSHLSPLDKSGFSGSELASPSAPGSPDISQASFSLSPPDLIPSDAEEGTPDGEMSLDARYMQSQGSIASSQHGSVDDAFEDIIWATTEECAVQWDYVCLEDVLDGLFEGADPWNALSELLGLPSSSVSPSSATKDILAMLGTSDRRGVGYTAPGSPPCSTSFPTSRGLTEGDSSTSDTGGIMSPTGLPLSRGDCGPCAGQQAREVETEFVESPIMETVLLHGSFLLPQYSGHSRNRQSSVMSLADRPGTATQANQTGEDFANEATHVANKESPYVALHFERNEGLVLVDGPSLFDDDLWCCEE